MLWVRVWSARGIVPVVDRLGKELGGFHWASGDQLHGSAGCVALNIGIGQGGETAKWVKTGLTSRNEGESELDYATLSLSEREP